MIEIEEKEKENRRKKNSTP